MAKRMTKAQINDAGNILANTIFTENVNGTSDQMQDQLAVLNFACTKILGSFLGNGVVQFNWTKEDIEHYLNATVNNMNVFANNLMEAAKKGEAEFFAAQTEQ